MEEELIAAMGNNPKNLKYTKDHEWARADGKVIVIGVTHHAQEALGDVVYVELPNKGDKVTQGQAFGVIESTKAVSELYAPVTGTVVNVNEKLKDEPQTVNQEPYGAGWMLELEPLDAKQLDALMDAAAYDKLLAEG